MDPLSYLAQTEQQLSFIIAREGRQGGAERDESPVGLIKGEDIKGGGRGQDEEESVRSRQGPDGPGHGGHIA